MPALETISVLKHQEKHHTTLYPDTVWERCGRFFIYLMLSKVDTKCFQYFHACLKDLQILRILRLRRNI
jgi:hypothetical protein